MEITIKEVTADTPPLKQQGSKYQKLFDRAKTMEVGDRFQAELESKTVAYCASHALRDFGRKNNMKFTFHQQGKTLEIKRLECAK